MRSALGRTVVVLVCGVITLGVAILGADAPHVYAITGARIVPAAGPPLASGTIVIRNGVIDAVGASVPAPDDAFVIDGKGATVYPGLIDMGSSVGVTVAPIPDPRTGATREEVDRWRRSMILRPDVTAATLVPVDAPELTRRTSAG